ncbi:unnamed protein product [Mesocestoides corti]|uniref:Purinergic receptor n=2 Tax=Mesocestoides corti TaxID=53468 RepID=A0A0R3UB97_MESCO|nr:unnamed protein product [Mesocestoides corti]
MGRPKARAARLFGRKRVSVRRFCCNHTLEFFTIYEMPKVIRIKGSLVGLLYRFLQLSIVGYFIGWVMIKEKGYQAFENPIHGVSAKVRGTLLSSADHPTGYLARGHVVYTDADLVYPPIQNSGFFLVTRVFSSVDQLQYTCPEASDLLDARCRSDASCPRGGTAGAYVPQEYAHLTNTSWFDFESYGHGPFTGRCLSNTRTCEVFAWCPILEDTDFRDPAWHTTPLFTRASETHNLASTDFLDTSFIEDRKMTMKRDFPGPVEVTPLYDVLNFTVLIRNSIEFPFNKVKRNNMLTWMDNDYLEKCRFNISDKKDQHCPTFLIKDIIVQSGADMFYILNQGGIIDININWDCDLDKALDKCMPTYSFRYLGALTKFDSTMRKMVHMNEKFNLEFATYFGSSQHRRLLHKVNGIQFLITVTGKGRKFSLLEFSMKVGSCLAVVGTATLICDLILTNCSSDKRRYKRTISRLSSLSRSAAFIARLERNCAPPKPPLLRPERLPHVIKFYASGYRERVLAGIRINITNEDGYCLATIVEEDRQCPSIITRRFSPVGIWLRRRGHQCARSERVFSCQHSPNVQPPRATKNRDVYYCVGHDH